LKIS
jgi:hypothetical protein